MPEREASISSAPAAPGIVLEITDLHVGIPTSRGLLKAVAGVSLAIREGETVGIVGESGCGKSMLALSVMGLVPAPGRIERGEIRLKGRDLVRLSERELRKIRGKDIGLIFQDPNSTLNPSMRIGAQVAEAVLAHQPVGAAAARARSLEMLRRVQIPAPDARMDAYPHQFSGGMRQRAVIAMGTVNSPAVVIADEPTTALDVTVQAQIIELLRRLNRESGAAIVLITHNIALLARFCRRMVVMYAGEIVEEGPTRRILDDPQHPYAAALIRSVPRLEREPRPLAAIEGRPPDLARKPQGCSFYPRCPYRLEKCLDHAPPLMEIAPGWRARCWVLMRNVAPGGQGAAGAMPHDLTSLRRQP